MLSSSYIFHPPRSQKFQQQAMKKNLQVKLCQRQNFNHHHAAKELSALSPNTHVWAPDFKCAVGITQQLSHMCIPKNYVDKSVHNSMLQVKALQCLAHISDTHPLSEFFLCYQVIKATLFYQYQLLFSSFFSNEIIKSFLRSNCS